MLGAAGVGEEVTAVHKASREDVEDAESEEEVAKVHAHSVAVAKAVRAAEEERTQNYAA